jgi:hypothetical protein
VIRCFYNSDEEVTRWVEMQLGVPLPRPSIGIGVVDGEAPIAGVTYTSYLGDPHTKQPRAIEMSIASVSPRWCTRNTLFQFFKYPFTDLGVQRVQVTVHRKNKHTRKFVERLGFVYEGKGRRAWPTGGDAVVYSMLPHECRWLNHGW